MQSTDDVTSTHGRAKAIVGVCLALGAFVLNYALVHIGVWSEVEHVLGAAGATNLGLVVNLLILALVLLWAIWVEGANWASLGMKAPTLGTLGWAVVAAVATFALIGAYYALIAPLLGVSVTTPDVAANTSRQSIGFVIILSLSAGLVEEMAFRFYPISRLHWLTANRWIASIIPMVVFVALHVPNFGWAMVIPVTMGALVLTLLYWFRRDYWCNALAHFLVDFLAFGAAALAVQR